MIMQWSGLQHSAPSMGMGLLPFSLKPGLFHQVKVTELCSVRAQCREAVCCDPRNITVSFVLGTVPKAALLQLQTGLCHPGWRVRCVGMCSVVWEGEHLIAHPYIYLRALSFTFLRIVWESKDSLSLPIPTVPCLMPQALYDATCSLSLGLIFSTERRGITISTKEHSTT